MIIKNYHQDQVLVWSCTLLLRALNIFSPNWELGGCVFHTFYRWNKSTGFIAISFPWAAICMLLLLFFLIFAFWPNRAACGMLIPRTRIEPVSPALEVWHLNHWTTREVPICLLMSHGQLSTSQGKVNVLFSLLFPPLLPFLKVFPSHSHVNRWKPYSSCFWGQIPLISPLLSLLSYSLQISISKSYGIDQ